MARVTLEDLLCMVRGYVRDNLPGDAPGELRVTLLSGRQITHTVLPFGPPPEPPADPPPPEPGAGAGRVPPPAPLPPCRHSEDFRDVVWFGQRQEPLFTPAQAAVVRQLWRAWENGTPGVSQETLIEGAALECGRLRDVFRGHPCWGTMIISPRRGLYMLNSQALYHAPPNA